MVPSGRFELPTSAEDIVLSGDYRAPAKQQTLSVLVYSRTLRHCPFPSQFSLKKFELRRVLIY